MSNHRMFSNRIANSSKFLQMPAETQLLYFHMVLRADDDGVVESYPLMKLLGLAPDNMRVLKAKGFIEELNEDQVVVINDWLEHNKIRADRKVNSIYIDLLKKKVPEAIIIAPKPRSDVKDNSKRIDGPSTVGISQVKLSQDKISKDSKETENTPSKEAESFFLEENPYQELLSVFSKDHDKVIIEKEFKKFILYWTELNKSGTKQRWQLEKTFEVKRRLLTWLSRMDKFSNKVDKKPIVHI